MEKLENVVNEAKATASIPEFISFAQGKMQFNNSYLNP